jgi:hypothetical protein
MTPLDLLGERVAAFLGPLELDQAARPNGITLLRSDHTVLMLSCFEQDGHVFCRLATILLVDFSPSLALLHRVLQLNNDLLLGSLQLFEDRTLALSVTLPGAALEADTFTHALRYIASASDTIAPALRELAGGRTGSDLMERGAPCSC